MIDKFVHSMADAMTGIVDGSTILLGGFGDVGIPTPLLDGLIAQDARDLTIVAVAGGRDGSAIERLLSLGRVRRLICSFVRPASLAGRLLQSGDLEVEIVPQGTLAERMRAAGAGITGFYTPTGADTLLAEGRETREIGGRLCLLEYPLPGDVALIEAWSADRWGNLTYRDSARNFNPVMAMAARLTIAMTRNVAALGELSPGDDRHAGGLRPSRAARAAVERTPMTITPLDRNGMAAWCARDIPEGWLVNLGIGIPTLVADFVPEDREVIFHAENGVIGVGGAPAADAINPFLINASTMHVTLRTGGSYVHHADSFAIARGGHLDLCVLGAFEVAENGDIANWARSADEPVKQVGGAMDLAIGAQRLWVVMEHTTRDGEPRLRQRCSYPLTAKGVVTRVYTNLAVLDVTPGGFVVRDMIPGMTLKALQDRTEAKLRAA